VKERYPLLADPLPDVVLENSIKDDEGKPLNFFRILGHHPRLLTRLSGLGVVLLQKGEAPVRDRELAILRTAARTRCEYEFGQHAILGRRCGVTDEEIELLATDGPIGEGWSDDDRLLLEMTDQLLDDADLDASTFAQAIERFGPMVLLELIVAVGTYRMIATIMNAARLQPEAGIGSWPQVRRDDA
jgi:4-carboxymuconolactone decarboxylase